MSAKGQVAGSAAPAYKGGRAAARRRQRRRLDMEIRATPEAVADVREALERLGVTQPLLDDARLLVSELVTNSVRHAGLGRGGRVHVNAEWADARLRVDVYDGARLLDDPPVAGAIRPAPGSESGWGLYLVDRLAVRWGRGHGKHWFELEARS